MMKKKFFKLFLFISLQLTLTSLALGITSDVSLSIKENIAKTTGNIQEKVSIEIKREHDDLYSKFIKTYNKLADSYNIEYKSHRQLISESSTIKQAFEHSKELLNFVISYLNKTSELKEQLYLETIVGPWSGNGEIVCQEKTKTSSIVMNRNFKASFDINQAGQISKGTIKGNQTVIFDSKQQKGVENKVISGSITGSVLPNEGSSVILKFEPFDKRFEKYNQLILTSKNIIYIEPVVTNKTIDEVFSLTTSNMKIYYNLILKTRKNISQTMKDRYALFFNDLLYLLSLTSQDIVSEGVYKNLQIYPESDYINEAFENYFINRNIYYSEYLYSIPLSKQKLEVYHAYLGELMDLSALENVGIVSKKTFKKLNLNIENKNNLINRTYYTYLNQAQKYYEFKISRASFSEKTILQEEYDLIKQELNEVAESGLIQ